MQLLKYLNKNLNQKKKNLVVTQFEINIKINLIFIKYYNK